MTRRIIIERVLPASAFPETPRVGAAIGSRAGTTALLITRVRPIKNNGSAPAFRIFGERVKTANLAPDAIIIPHKPGASHAAEPPRLGPFQIPLPGATNKQQRERVISLKRAHRDEGIAPAIQVATGKVEATTFRDPDDLNPRHRFAREVSSFRSTADPIRFLIDRGSISRQQGTLCGRLRRDFELGIVGLSTGVAKYSPDRIKGIGASAGPSQMQMEHIEYFRGAETAVGHRLFDILKCCILLGETILDYSTRTQTNRMAASGRLSAAIDRLQDHYDLIDAARQRTMTDA